ncbi:MAG: AI-2E family transporter [Xanthomonadales bacterium]|nr:AI-2E family transporter [Xanthomonadales bacterium]
MEPNRVAISDSQKWLILACVLALVWFIRALGPILTPFVISAVLAYLGDPLVDRLQKWMSRTKAVLLVFCAMLLNLVLIVLLLLPLLEKQITYLISNLPMYADWITSTAWPWVQQRFGLHEVDLGMAQLTDLLKPHWQEAGGLAAAVLGNITQSGMAFLAMIGLAFLIPVITFYLLRDWDDLLENIRQLLPRYVEPGISKLAGESNEMLGAFFRGQILVMMALGVIYAIGLSLIGLQLAVLIGLVAGLLSIVPYLGFAVGLIAALIAAAVQFQDVFHVVLVLVIFGGGQMLEGMVLTPWLVGDRIGLHPVVVIFAVLAGGQLMGFVGMLIALPVAAVLNVLLRHANELYRDSQLFDREVKIKIEKV